MPISLAYVSSAAWLLDRDELHTLLTASRASNAAGGITGALLYQDGTFMQILEGDDPDQLDSVFQRISRDPRHHDVEVMVRRDVPTRSFGEWTMAFRDFSGDPGDVPEGFSDFFNRRYDAGYFGDQPTAAQRLLLSFHRALNPTAR